MRRLQYGPLFADCALSTMPAAAEPNRTAGTIVSYLKRLPFCLIRLSPLCPLMC